MPSNCVELETCCCSCRHCFDDVFLQWRCCLLCDVTPLASQFSLFRVYPLLFQGITICSGTSILCKGFQISVFKLVKVLCTVCEYLHQAILTQISNNPTWGFYWSIIFLCFPSTNQKAEIWFSQNSFQMKTGVWHVLVAELHVWGFL